jgi:ATP-binding cassette subfamily B protein
MLALTWHYRWGCVQIILLQSALLGMGLAGLGLMGTAIDVISHQVDPATKAPQFPFGIVPPAGYSPLQIVACLAGAVLLLALGRSVLNFLHSVTVARVVQSQIVVDLRAAVYEKLQRLSFRFFSANTSGSIISRVTSDTQNVRVFVDGVILQIFILVLSLACYLVYMLSINVMLTLVCLATTPILWTLAGAFSRAVRPAYDRNRELFDRLLLALTENIRGVQVVKGFARQPEEEAKFAHRNKDVRDQQQWIFWRISVFSPSIEFLMSLNLAVLLGYGGYLVVNEQLALGSGLIVFSGLLQQLSGQVTKVTNIANSIQQSLTGARRVFEILDAPLEIESSPRAKRLPSSRGSVTLERVSFAYEGGDTVLEDLDLEVASGQCVAILGATGAGKTTLLNLIPRFYDPTCGRVLVDGHDICDLDLDDLRRNIGVVFQENFLFSDTIATNIAFGHPDATRDQIERAARIAAAHEFIRDMPNGYDTVLREGGKNLSGGQRQRLAIARALLLEPSILLLDDPTASIDPATEHEILEAMEQAMQGRTTFVVAHRLSTLRRADVVVVLDGGRIVEQGRHDELIRANGHYWQAATLQSGNSAGNSSGNPVVLKHDSALLRARH